MALYNTTVIYLHTSSRKLFFDLEIPITSILHDKYCIVLDFCNRISCLTRFLQTRSFRAILAISLGTKIVGGFSSYNFTSLAFLCYINYPLSMPLLFLTFLKFLKKH
ncbi:hypothetical protein C2G38_2120669 [Gigaspora rosea]|uniref:Uncharacterized protein n=1 Tax=Gigaspora rosea TaxID=44941 RepID=A0A397U2I7_9GLOM|nr:hypothetical protein C2G38_2120669 [Gigaspora rosea]